MIRLTRLARPKFKLTSLIRYNHSDPLGLSNILKDLNTENQSPNPPDSPQDLTSFLESLEVHDEPGPYGKSLDIPLQEPKSDVIAQEQELFRDIFASLNTGANKTPYPQKIFQNLQDYQNLRKSDHESHVTKLEQIDNALAPTLSHIDSMNSRYELAKEFYQLLKKISQVLSEDNLGKFTLESEEFDALIEDVKRTCEQTPTSPVLNTMTISPMINQYLKTSINKFKDGQLALTMFNTLKNDIHIYLVGCDQNTYNEILKTIWIFHGRNDLYQVEVLVTEMVNNGFQGNLSTFNILKQIILDYYGLKMSTDVSTGSNLPIWNRDDDERVGRLEQRLRAMSQRIKRES